MAPDPTSNASTVSVVVPVYNELANLDELHQGICDALARIPGKAEIVYVDDGSRDGSREHLEKLARENDGVMVVELSRNYGMEIAMSAGVDHASGDHVVLMHSDLQDPPELIPEMIDVARSGADVVYSRRIGKDESFVKIQLATAFHWLMRRLARVPYEGQAGDFRVMSRRVVEAVKQMPERRRFLRGMVAWVGYNQVPFELRRADRASGRGASYSAMFRIAFEALTAFSDVPLSLATYFGIFISALAAVGSAVLVILAANGVLQTTMTLWVLVAVLFLGGVQLISVGIVGRYLARIHEESLHRPLYLVNRLVSRTAAEPGIEEPPATEPIIESEGSASRS